MGRTIKALWAAFFFSMIPVAHAQTAAWTISELAGRVTISDGSRQAPGQRGTVIAPGAILSTGPGARAVVVRGRDFMTLAANSRVRVPVTNEKRGLLEVIQEWGNAVFNIEKRSAPRFGVRTPYLAAVVKGTTFSITVTQEGASLQVVEGAVETSTVDGGAVDLIRPGIVASVTRGDLMRLTVQGQDTRHIDSPQRVASVAPASLPTDASSGIAPLGESSAETFESQVIAVPVAAEPVDLGRATDGLVTGSSAVQLAGINAAGTAYAKRAERGASEHRSDSAANAWTGNAGNSNSGGSGISESRDNGNGNGNGNANARSNGNGNGNGNANAGSNGNGNDRGNSGSNGNGNGNGNANAGSNGNGNDQGNSGSNGNGNGNGNANAGSNGNGNGN